MKKVKILKDCTECIVTKHKDCHMCEVGEPCDKIAKLFNNSPNSNINSYLLQEIKDMSKENYR